MREEKESFYWFNNTIRDLMCSRCNQKVRIECCGQSSVLNRTASMIACMKNILEPNDEKYPTRFKKAG